jgi:hypothetical protein
MSTLRVTVVFEFNNVEPGTERDESIVMSITEACETMQTGFDANACWVDDAEFITAERSLDRFFPSLKDFPTIRGE